MKITNYILLGFIVLFFSSELAAQRKLSEATITYDIVINTGDKTPQTADLLDGATSIVYLKANSSRSEMVSSLGVQATVIDGKTGSVTVLKEYGDQKYMINMTKDNWKETNKKYEGITFIYETETKIIQGYTCQKAIGTLADSSTFTVYYTKDLMPVNKDFQYLTKNLPGLAMQYEASLGTMMVTYTVSNINFNPVVKAKFELPKSGYRILTYEESKGNGGN